MWQAKFLIKESKNDSTDNLSKAAELAQLAWKYMSDIDHIIL